MEEPPSFCSTRSWTSYGFQIRTLKTALRPLDKKKQWRCCCMETVPFFTPRGKLILNKGAMPSISGLKGLSVCVNVVSKNTKLIWQNLNSAETKKKNSTKTSIGQGWRSGESTLLPPMSPGFKSRRRRHMWVEFVVGSLPCSERFLSGFPLSSKTNTSKFQFDLERTDTFKRVHMNS